MWGIALGNCICFVWEMVRLDDVRRRALAAAAEAPAIQEGK